MAIANRPGREARRASQECQPFCFLRTTNCAGPVKLYITCGGYQHMLCQFHGKGVYRLAKAVG